MTKAFELIGTTDEKFKQLELIIQRVRQRNAKRILTLPPSIICCQIENFVTPYRCLMFAGRVEKIAYSFLSVTQDGKAVELDLTCSVINASDIRTVNIKGKRLNGIVNVNAELSDGAIISVQSNDSNIRYDGGLVSILYTPKFITTKLAEVAENEGV